MPKFALIVLGLLLSLLAKGQYRPQHSLYLLNNYLINPAITGIESYGDLKAGYRSQWTGLKGAPITYYLSYHMPLQKSSLRTYKPNPTKRSGKVRESVEVMQSNTQLKRHHGVGGSVMADRTGSFQRTEVNASYAYHLPLTRQITASLGASLGLIQYGLDYNKIILANPNDPFLANGLERQYQTSLNLGFWLYSSKFYFGGSAAQLLKEDVLYVDAENGNVRNAGAANFFVTGGYRFKTDLMWDFIPSILVKRLEDSPVTFDAAIKTIYNRCVWAGGVYRNNEAIVVFAGGAINSNLDFTYSFDYGFSRSQLDRYSSGSHEVVLSVRLFNHHKVLCPDQLW